MKILFATANQHKAFEIQKIVPKNIEIITLKDIDLKEDIPETSATIEGNAKQKADYIATHFNIDCFADDTGLEIECLNGEPGVYSARYAGEERDAEKNTALVLKKMEGVSNRKARFKTVIALYYKKQTFFFEGIVEGTIRTEKSGNEGFGYDPVFEPENCGKTFAEMSIEEKNKMSHRARAVDKMIRFFESNSIV